jgi:uncharacterized protein (TIGR02117 family)
MPKPLGIALKCCLWSVAALLTSALLYFACVGVLGAMRIKGENHTRSNADIIIYLRSNGIHTDVVLPALTPHKDWRARFPARDFAAPKKPPKTPIPLVLEAHLPPDANPRATHVAFGWGDQGFYFDTPEWRDLTAKVALNAVFGLGLSAMHVEYLPTPEVGERVKRITLSITQYQRLVDFLEAGFARNPDGSAQAYVGYGYTLHDTFYVSGGAHRSFSMFKTCNEWVRQGLQHAGLTVPVWSPFPGALFAALP